MPDPLHPAMVHLPLGLTILAPLLVLAVLLGISKKLWSPKTWWLVTGFLAVLTGATFGAVATGEEEGELFEGTAIYSAVHEHEEAGEGLLWACVAALVIAALALVPKLARWAGAARWATLAVTLAAVVLAVRTGSMGGDLVYREGAAEKRPALVKAHQAHEAEEDREDEDD